jgi:hypothetical protein
MYKQIVYIPHSIAFADENGIIYINKCLKTFDKNLYNRILKHEQGHTVGDYNKYDFQLDLKNNISQMELLKFCLAHPSGFMQYSPIVKVKDTWFYSWLSLTKLLITISVIMLIFWII